MADISKDELRTEIAAILKDADLTQTSAKKVRQELETKLDCNLASRKQEIDELVMSYVNSKNEGSDEDEDDEEEEVVEKKAPKRPAPDKRPAKKSKKNSSEDESESENSDESEEYTVKKPVPKKKAPSKKKAKGSESDSDSDWGKKERAKKAAGGGGRGKGGGYTRAYKLSPQLASLMGNASMARHEVVKKMWALIKERNLYDPNNKQFAICDDDLYKVIGVKRFRTFGMMKYLKSHFHE